MRKIKLYIASSLNGKIARLDGDIQWLESIPNPDGTDHGYSEFYNSIDTTIQGYNTFNQIRSWEIEFPYADKKNYVFTNKQDPDDFEHVEFICKDHIDFVKQLKKEKGKDIWLIGGGQINTFLLNEGLIDEIQVFVMPVVIPDGIEIFEKAPKLSNLELISTKSYSTGAVELKYRFKKHKIHNK